MALLCCAACSGAETSVIPAKEAPLPENATAAVFGGGCFWCTEAIYQRVDGVLRVTPGYAGGKAPKPSYQSVCKGTTGHAEVVRIMYDPALVTFEQLLDVFFATHDPTTLNKQGADVGTQYRSVIFCQDETQKKQAQNKIDALNKAGVFPKPIVTVVGSAATFYEAEDYHRNYFGRNGGQPYCRAVIAPKVRKFEKSKADILGAD
ncbi:MAG: peptide-methionine (S)-S-oxide reductase MsrA [Lentisphaerae bacterium]|nr:peptide-methionine (S)-S-oxide reductase MsrA [Lentisphaerota bacterium]MBT4815552.1 peptide-methionine (S)-S-oxide reductase MsrA [Lentisphaerota bacterium]MBT5613215.1 peptide-methionine (S)-S-oxide reductase MsrA [Lentisphaerota bacterium]MBT7062122.1 peptide-methionine (S)-S-oxide reductase MsrA [Lentisphaerota bacterium]MBT7847634.1 peptide-methionine (S)-S-oxide reductase MsrA [Lentisphaerota bacterium]